ncbi:ImmA/IrrE family metallo-endopeptidase [Sphingomonas sp. CFBP 13728]|uniref:ImmA/IrrE family metallo-endopeptidase n=1 Tax=Sphingomonas sp. CFBP 13728 TaxID=2775294 RepID=UPI00177D26AF|nr:ImmA/IrrE family metallo-endopeptidase [Sphingomonas sp. CFBP 13728]MBD8619742.1 ImmA/IrrE family metallo-endopeptidase [Sphingomonas sp. CFBP 13728]
MTTLAIRAGIPSADLRRALEVDGELEDDEIEAIAEQLAVPVEAFFMDETPPLLKAVDFRTATPHVSKFKKGTLEAIGYVERIAGTLASLELGVEIDPSLAPITTAYTDGEAIELAKKWRKSWGFSIQEQLDAANSNTVYVSLRSYIESLGVLVLHKSFGTDEAAGIYAHIPDGPHAIVINTTLSSKARKLFTLAHEFCHVLLRAEGTSNPSIIKNKVEKFCNKFAAYLLAPNGLINNAIQRFGYPATADHDNIRRFAKRLGISQEALVRRLVEIGYITQANYTTWRSKFNGVVPPGDTTDGQGGGKTDPLQTKRTTYGSRLLSLLGNARQRGLLDDLDIYRLCGLKRKYQDDLFGIV